MNTNFMYYKPSLFHVLVLNLVVGFTLSLVLLAVYSNVLTRFWVVTFVLQVCQKISVVDRVASLHSAGRLWMLMGLRVTSFASSILLY